MANGEDEDYQDSVIDFINDAVVASAHMPLAMPANELLGAGWAGSWASSSTTAWIRRRVRPSSLRSWRVAAGLNRIR